MTSPFRLFSWLPGPLAHRTAIACLSFLAVNCNVIVGDGDYAVATDDIGEPGADAARTGPGDAGAQETGTSSGDASFSEDASNRDDADLTDDAPTQTALTFDATDAHDAGRVVEASISNSTSDAAHLDATKPPVVDASMGTTGSMDAQGTTVTAEASSADGGGSPAPDAGLFCGGCLEVYYKNNGAPAQTGELEVPFQLRNTGLISINLSSLVIRYYFSSDACPVTGLSGRCDSSLLNNRVTDCPAARVVALPTPKPTANAYIELTFGGKSVLPPTATPSYQAWGAIFQPAHNCTFQQGNDYSYNATATDFTLAPTMTAYINGMLVWGKEP